MACNIYQQLVAMMSVSLFDGLELMYRIDYVSLWLCSASMKVWTGLYQFALQHYVFVWARGLLCNLNVSIFSIAVLAQGYCHCIGDLLFTAGC